MPKKFGFAFWQSQRERLQDLYYNQGLSSNAIGKIYGCYGETITFNMNRLGFKLRQIGSKERPNALYKVNSSFFETIDTEEKAYILGYVITDGHVTNDGKLMFAAAEKDRDILEKIKVAMQSTHHIKEKIIHNKPQCILDISSEAMCKDIRKYGIDNRKSYTLKMDIIQNTISPELERHLIRGMIDGDGSLICTMNKSGFNKKHTLTISFTGNQNVCGYIAEKLKMTNKWRDEGNGIYSIKTNKRDQVIQIGSYLYDDATIYLNRKKNKFDEMRQTYLIETDCK